MWDDDPTAHAAALRRELNRMPDPSLNPCEQQERELDRLTERICTLEDALRPFATHHTESRDNLGGCSTCSWHVAWPCKYETARRALEGE